MAETTAARQPGIESLPSEILLQIIQACETRSIFSLYLVSHRFKDLVDAHPWRELCEREFRYWSPEHEIRVLETSGVKNDTRWQHLFTERWRKQKETTRLLNSILEGQSGRIEKYEKIVELGYDAKDCLLRHLSVNENADDGLARRWYADAVLGCLHRSMAIHEWSKLQDEGLEDIEKALTAFDMFVLHDREGDFQETRTQLDAIAASIKAEDSFWDTRTTRQKALAIAAYLRVHELVGIRGRQETYHDLRNNFIGFAVHDSNHASLPLISASIYSGVARRLGVRASPCALPFHVFVVVQPKDGMDLEDSPRPTQEPDELHTYRTSDTSDRNESRYANMYDSSDLNMYLDPFDTSSEIPLHVLTTRLNVVGIELIRHREFLQPATVTDLILRTGRNILTSVQENHRGLGNRVYMLEQASTSNPFTDLEGAFYGALWAALLYSRPPNGDGPVIATLNRRNYLPAFVEHFETHFPMDAAVIERHIVPIFQDSPECDQLRESVRVMRSVDYMPKDIKIRTDDISKRVKYKIGQVFRHKRYYYLAVITGWDIECGAGEQWMARMRVNELAKGGDQSFYHVLVEDKSIRYVAEENIEIVTPTEVPALMPLAGRHFKRWDRESSRFISNIKDEYPDD